MNATQLRTYLGICILEGIVVSRAGGDDAQLKPSRRPSNVPTTAVRTGGADGGAYIQCLVDKAQNVNHCTIWNDNTGDRQSADFRLHKEERAAWESELVYEGGTVSDHRGQIWLKGGKLLTTLNYHY